GFADVLAANPKFLFFSWASSMMLLRMCMGCCVLFPGNPAQLLGARMLYLVKTLDNLLLRILVKIFQIVSKSAIGLVRLMSPCHSLGLGIGNISPLLQSLCVFPSVIIWLNIIVME